MTSRSTTIVIFVLVLLSQIAVTGEFSTSTVNPFFCVNIRLNIWVSGRHRRQLLIRDTCIRLKVHLLLVIGRANNSIELNIETMSPI